MNCFSVSCINGREHLCLIPQNRGEVSANVSENKQFRLFESYFFDQRKQNSASSPDYFFTYLILFSPSFSLTAKPKSPSLNSMSELRKKLPTLISRCMTRWACRYEHACTAWNMRYRTSGSVSLPRFFSVCTKDCRKTGKGISLNRTSCIQWTVVKVPNLFSHIFL